MLVSRYSNLLCERYSSHDAGWGCSLRSLQSLLASALLTRLDPEEVAKTLLSPRGALSFASLLSHGGGWIPGKWMGPHQVTSHLGGWILPSSIRVVFCSGGVIDMTSLPVEGPWPVLLLIPLRLNPDSYLTVPEVRALLGLMRDQAFCGMIGGPPGRCTFILGPQDNANEGGRHWDEVVVLDPHTVKPECREVKELLSALQPQDPPLTLRLTQCSSSFALALLIRDASELEVLRKGKFDEKGCWMGLSCLTLMSIHHPPVISSCEEGLSEPGEEWVDLGAHYIEQANSATSYAVASPPLHGFRLGRLGWALLAALSPYFSSKKN